MIDLIKSIFGVPKKNGIYIIVISLALQLCLIDRDFKLNLDKFLFSNDNSYDIIKICIQYNYAIIVVLICLGIFLESLYSLLFTIDIHQSNVTDKNLLYKHKSLIKNTYDIENMILPYVAVLYLLTVIMSIHTSIDYALEYVIAQILWYQLIFFLISYTPFIVEKVYEYIYTRIASTLPPSACPVAGAFFMYDKSPFYCLFQTVSITFPFSFS